MIGEWQMPNTSLPAAAFDGWQNSAAHLENMLNTGYGEIGIGLSRGTVMGEPYLQAAYPTAEGFSPRNLRRMRAFYATYEESPDIMRLAMLLGWTRNVAILEGCGSSEERAWYIRAVLHFGWKKAKLLAAIESQAWLHSTLDEQAVSCYTGEKEISQESEWNEKDTLCVSRQYPKKPRKSLLFQWVSSLRWRLLHHNYTICERALM